MAGRGRLCKPHPSGTKTDHSFPWMHLHGTMSTKLGNLTWISKWNFHWAEHKQTGFPRLTTICHCIPGQNTQKEFCLWYDKIYQDLLMSVKILQFGGIHLHFRQINFALGIIFIFDCFSLFWLIISTNIIIIGAWWKIKKVFGCSCCLYSAP